MTQRDNQQRRNTRQRMRRRSEVTKTKKTQAVFERRLRQNRSEVYIPSKKTNSQKKKKKKIVKIREKFAFLPS